MAASLLLIPLGFIVWLLCYGPAMSTRTSRNDEIAQQSTQSTGTSEHDLLALLQVADPEDRREG